MNTRGGKWVRRQIKSEGRRRGWDNEYKTEEKEQQVKIRERKK